MKKTLSILLALVIVFAFAGCSQNQTNTANETTSQETKENDIYMTLVNKTHKLPDNWTDMIELATGKNSMGEEYQVEKVTLEHYEALRKALLEEGVDIELDSTYRTVEEQQDLAERFTKEYGADYVKKYVAVPGYSEHHTGLVIDICIVKDGKVIDENDDMIAEKEIFSKIHNKLADYGFILRYIEGKEHITGYNYEPWHLRYINDEKVAKEIMDKGITLEEYLGTAKDADVKIDYGKSDVYSEEQMKELVNQIKCQFADEQWQGCELHSIKYVGDECNSKENVKWVNEQSEGKKYTGAAEFLVDFHTAKDIKSTLDPDQDYKDYQFWLACDAEGDWDIVSWGY